MEFNYGGSEKARADLADRAVPELLDVSGFLPLLLVPLRRFRCLLFPLFLSCSLFTFISSNR